MNAMNGMKVMNALNAADASGPPPPALQVQALNVRLGDRTVVQDVGFTLARGATLALLGPSGCG